MTVTTSPIAGKSTKETVKTIRAGNAGLFGEPVVTMLVCFSFFAREAAGAHQHPAFPAPSFQVRDKTMQNSDAFASREGGVVAE
jgi:hypothetical protein